MKRWYVLRSKARSERLLWQQLCSQNIDSYAPQLVRGAQSGGPRKSAPFFPGYVFAHADLDIIGGSALQWMPGAIGVVCFGGEPAYISDIILAGIRARVDAVNAMAEAGVRSIGIGEEVHIYSGPFAGYRGIFERTLSDCERAIVLLSFVRDQQIRVELPVNQIMSTKQYRARL